MPIMRIVPCALAMCCAALAPAVEVNLQAGAAAVTEGGSVTVTAIRSDAVGALSVPVNLTGTPPAGVSLSAGSFAFAAGALTATVQLQTTGDSTANGVRQATMQITVGGGITSTNPAVSIGVRDDDVRVALSAIDVGAGESPADDGRLRVTVSGQPRSGTLAVQFEVHGTAKFDPPTAANDNDFTLAVQIGAGDPTTITPAAGVDVVEVTIPADESTVTITVTPIADGRVEGGETCEIRLPTSSLAYVVDGADRAAVTIADDDNRIASFAGTPAFESGPDGAIAITFLSSFAGRSVQVPYSLGGTASNGEDYTTLSGVATLSAGNLTLNIPIDAIYDQVFESETLVFTLLPSPDYTLPGTPSLTLPLVDVAGSAAIAAPLAAAVEGDADSPLDFTVTVTRFADFASGDISIPFRLSGGTAGSGEYSVGGSGVAWNAGTSSGVLTLTDIATTGSVRITPVDDSLADGDKTVRVLVEAGQSVVIGGTANATGTISDDEPVVSLSREDGDTITEGGPGRTFTFSYPGVPDGVPLGVPVTIPFTITGGSATSDRELTGTGLSLNPDGLGGSVTIPAGVRTVDILVGAATDETAEPNETVILTLSPPVQGAAYRLGSPTTAQVVLVDSAAVPTVEIVAVADAIEGRSIRCFAIRRSGATTAALTVKLDDPSGSASSADYQPLPDDITIPVGASSATLAVAAIADGPDAGETIELSIAADAAYLIDTGTATIDIVDGFTDALIGVASEVQDPVLGVGDDWTSTCLLSLPTGLRAGRTRGSLIAVTGGPAAPDWVTIARTSAADVTGEAVFTLTGSPPLGAESGPVLFRVLLEVDIDGDGTFETARPQDVLLWVLASGGSG
jgi:hypothetical protein